MQLFKGKKNKSSENRSYINEPTTQDWIPVQDVYNDLMYRKDNAIVGVIRVEPINLNLYSDVEQKRIVKSLADILNGFDYPYEWLSIPRPVDLDAYIADLELKKMNENDFVKRQILEEDRAHAATMASEGDAIERQFYFIHFVPLTSKIRSQDEEVCHKRSIDLATDLTNMGLKSKVSKDQDLRELLFIFNNPVQAAYERAPFLNYQYPPIVNEGD